MLSHSPSDTPLLRTEFQALFDEAVRDVVAIIETKHVLEPQERAARLIEQAIGCSRNSTGLESQETGDTETALKLVRVSGCLTVVRGLGLSEGELSALLVSAANSRGIEHFSTSSLRSSLEDLLIGQEEAAQSKFDSSPLVAQSSLRRNIVLNWLPAVFILSKVPGDIEAHLTLFGAYMRGFAHVNPLSRSQLIEETLLGGPHFRARVSCGENACDFRTLWRTAPFGYAPAHTQSTFPISERAELYREIRPLFKPEDDPNKINRICRALASPLFEGGSGLKELLRGPFTEHERRLLMLTWAAVYEQERARISLEHVSFSDQKAVKEGEQALEHLRAVLAERTVRALQRAVAAPQDGYQSTRLAHRVAAELCGIDLALRSEWGAILLSSKTFAQFAVEAPELLVDFVSVVQHRSERALKDVLIECDEALYRDALHTHSPQLLLALLPHITHDKEELQVLMSLVRGYQMETCGSIRVDQHSGTYNLGLFELDNGPPAQVTVREDFLFAWKFDPRFVHRVTQLWREWYGIGEADGERHEGRASAKSDLVTFVQKYLAEHQPYHDTYRYLQGETTRKLSFMFDDSPFPKGPERDQAYRETFEVMRRNFDLSLRFFTFLDFECKRAPAHAESLFGRFMRQSYTRCVPARDTASHAFPGNGWRTAGLKLNEFGLSPETLQQRFRSSANTLSHLNQLNVLMTQGLFAVWCPTCVDTNVDGEPHVWVVFNRHFHPSGNCVGSLVPLSRFEHVLSRLEAGEEFTSARGLMSVIGDSSKNLCWMGNLSGTLSNAYSFNTGPFSGELALAASGVSGQEPGGHVHKHYLLQHSLTMRDEFEEHLTRFQDAHHSIYRAYNALHLLLNVGVLYPFSLFKKGFSVNSLRPEDHDRLEQLDIHDAPHIHPHHLLMMLYAEDVHRAVRQGRITPGEATVVTYADPFMINHKAPKIALDCATLQVGTWDASGWHEIDDLTEYDWPQRGEAFIRYFGDAFRSNSLDLKSVTKKWIGL